MWEEDIGDLYKRYYKDIYRYVYILTLNPDDTEDILQNVFLKVIKNMKSFRGKSSVKTWLFTIARNESLNYMAKNKRKAAAADISQITITVSDHMDEKLLQQEEIRAVIRFIQNQGEPAKSLLILRLLEERSFAEISGVLGQSDTWCRVNFFRLKKKMADALAREMGEG